MKSVKIHRWEGQPWHVRLGARLFLAFLAITGFAALAILAAFVAFRGVGQQLIKVDSMVAPAVSALEISRSAERIIAAAPSLEAARHRADVVKAKANLELELERLTVSVNGLKRKSLEAESLDKVEKTASLLRASLFDLNSLALRRLVFSERLERLRDALYRANEDAQRLLTPWLLVTDSEMNARISEVVGQSNPDAIISLVEHQRLIRATQQHISDAVDILVEISTVQQEVRLPVLSFQVNRALDELETVSALLDPRLRSRIREELARLRDFATGTQAISDIRRQELRIDREAATLLSTIEKLSTTLTDATNALGEGAKQEINNAISSALTLQEFSLWIFVTIALLSFAISFLVVWLYVGRRVTRRLDQLSKATLAIAAGDLSVRLNVSGTDEIAAMERAVEIFRSTAEERNRLLEERAQAADRLEQEVAERTAELETANRFKSRFLAAASHDLRQPLHALNLFVGQLRNQRNPAEEKRLEQRIYDSVSSLNELFDALLDMSKLEAGVLEADITVFPIAAIFERIETTFADAARQKGIRLKFMPSSAWVKSDPILLERILLNLTSNAIKVTETGGVLLGSRRRGEALRIDVYDTGPGIAERLQKTIFEEFYRMSPRPADRSESLGLGLSIVDGLARLLGHDVELVSAVGRGSRFSVTVPAAAAQVTAEVQMKTPFAIDPMAGRRILVIENDPLVSESMAGMLTAWGSEVVLARDSDEARKTLSKMPPPDLIISDYRLEHGRTGLEAIAEFNRVAGYDIPAFLITGDTTAETLSDITQSGYRILYKPVTPIALRALSAKVLADT